MCLGPTSSEPKSAPPGRGLRGHFSPSPPWGPLSTLGLAPCWEDSRARRAWWHPLLLCQCRDSGPKGLWTSRKGIRKTWVARPQGQWTAGPQFWRQVSQAALRMLVEASSQVIKVLGSCELGTPAHTVAMLSWGGGCQKLPLVLAKPRAPPLLEGVVQVVPR